MDKIKVIQIGMFHEHAIGKIEVLKQRSDLFELIGFVFVMERMIMSIGK